MKAKVRETMENSTGANAGPRRGPERLSSTVIAIGLVSLFSDWSHELVTSLLPSLLVTLGAPPIALGLIEGVSDACSAAAKYWAGAWSDRHGRKPLMVAGYTATALLKPAVGFASSWGAVLGLRVLAWTGRGARGAPRDVLLAEEAPAGGRGRAFGLHRTMDTLGAIAGPLSGSLLIAAGLDVRTAILLSVIPGVISVVIVIGWVRERGKVVASVVRPSLHPARNPAFQRFLIIVALFGMANYAHTFLILRSEALLAPGHGRTAAVSISVALYTLFNGAYAALSYPMGRLADRLGSRYLLFVGYAVFGIVSLLFAIGTTSVPLLALYFLVAGLYIGTVDALESTLASAYLPSDVRGRGFGLLGAVNGVGDLVASVGVGFLYTVAGAGWAFGAAGAVALTAAALGASPFLSAPGRTHDG